MNKIPGSSIVYAIDSEKMMHRYSKDETVDVEDNRGEGRC